MSEDLKKPTIEEIARAFGVSQLTIYDHEGNLIASTHKNTPTHITPKYFETKEENENE